MTRDKVIEYAIKWMTLEDKATDQANYFFGKRFDCDERQDVLNACADLAFVATKEALAEYTKEREAKFAAHERMLDTIEATLQESIKDGL